MNKTKLEAALYRPVILVLKPKHRILKGYLVKDQYNKKRYKILPLDISDDILVFPRSYVKQFTYMENGYTVK